MNPSANRIEALPVASNDFLTKARDYLDQGFSVIPVGCKSKVPLETWRDYQQRRASLEEINHWSTQSRDLNIGIVTGAISGLVVVDLDTPEAKEKLQQMIGESVYSAIPRVRTGRGQQLYFRHPGPRVPNRTGVLPGMDIRGDGGFVVAPHSVHPNGSTYQWEVLIEGELPEIPAALLNLIMMTPKADPNVKSVDGIDGIPEGKRNATLTSLAGAMRARGMGESAISPALQEHNRSRCVPPLPEEEVARIVASVSRYPARCSPNTFERKPLQDTEIGVRCSRDNIEDKRPPTSSEAVAFPEVAWSGLFWEWRNVVARCTEAPLEFLWATFLTIVGLMLGRSVWIESPQPLHPNFYVLLLGQTGDARKSTALWLARQLLNRLNDEAEIINGIVSTEGLFERLAKREETRALGYVDEFRSLLSVGRRHGTRDLMPKLNSLLYCPEQETIDRRKDPTIIIRPFFSLIAATAQDYVADLIGGLELSGGVLNRYLMVTGEEQPPKAIARPPSDWQWGAIVRELQRIRDQFQEPRRFDWSDQAKELWTDFYVSWRRGRNTWDIKSQALTARIQDHIQKIALVYSVLAGESAISASSLATAISIGEWLEKTILRLFETVGLDQFSRAELDVLKIVRTKGRLPRRLLQQLVSKKGINGKLLGEVLRSLEANGHVHEYPVTTMSGQPSRIIEYMPDNREHLSPSGTSENVERCSPNTFSAMEGL